MKHVEECTVKVSRRCKQKYDLGSLPAITRSTLMPQKFLSNLGNGGKLMQQRVKACSSIFL